MPRVTASDVVVGGTGAKLVPRFHRIKASVLPGAGGPRSLGGVRGVPAKPRRGAGCPRKTSRRLFYGFRRTVGGRSGRQRVGGVALLPPMPGQQSGLLQPGKGPARRQLGRWILEANVKVRGMPETVPHDAVALLRRA